jgi:hypothetical protein
MVDITEISAMVAAAGVLVGVVYYMLDMRNQSRTRQTDLTFRLYQGILTDEVTNYWYQVKGTEGKDFNEYVKRQGWKDLLKISTYFEGVGFLLHRKLLDIDMARELFAEAVKQIWEKPEPMFKEMHSDKAFWFEYLYNEMKKREQAGFGHG